MMLSTNSFSYFLIKFKKNLKFTEEGRFSFGVCVRLGKDGEEGVRLAVFDYTSILIVGIKKYELLIKHEIMRVRLLTVLERLSQKWAGSENRPDNSLWVNDKVQELKKIGPAKAIKLQSAGIITVKDVIEMTTETMKEVSRVSGIGKKTLLDLQDQSQTALPGDSPYPIAFDWVVGNTNPYLARYGDSWRDEIKKVSRSGLTRVKCVTELIIHIDTTTKNAYKDTPYKDNYFWAHDALSQMCDDDAIEWMKEEGYYDRWITPEMKCNEFISVYDEEKKVQLTSRRYKHRPVGNQPELMPLDASLNRDIDCSYDMHVLLTAHLDKEDPRKFRKDTPKHISKAILKLYDPITGVVPRPKRILEDCWRVVSSLKTIVEAGRKIVPGLVNRNGHRNKANQGRKYYPKKKDQVIATMTEMGIFSDVQKIAMEQFADETLNFNS